MGMGTGPKKPRKRTAYPDIAGFVFELLCAALQARPEDPPRDMVALIGLLLELKVAGRGILPPAAREALAVMRLGGNGRTLQRASRLARQERNSCSTL